MVSSVSDSASRRPRVGVTTYYQEGTWGVWSSMGAIVPSAYVEAVASAGGAPMLLPPVGIDAAALDVLDGLIIIGGPDVDPAHYGAEPHPETDPKPLRDAFEIELTRAAMDRGLPVLAICRGAQILNVALGGTLHQHLPEITDRAHEYRPAPGEYGRVEFSTAPGSICRTLLGERAWSPCYHHQSLDRVADGLTVTASADDGTIEAVETADGSWVVGVQFHPEENRGDPRLFEGFVDALRGRDVSRASAADQEAPL
ncbi:gamma-glutamyl-gamma-aminobutyrate hydrolase family protein [Kocuria palustris]|uniref:gamma-glutamyl-gamma-aminobutyrate hydrolase family protein n=1 Tax=Kocuria palustris TaxID=71999 RepID=UPI00119EAC75|nr:gamma-glutamyl-gamma-aminobutyrate hydrolase family protein [Kocuria palustris]